MILCHHDHSSTCDKRSFPNGGRNRHSPGSFEDLGSGIPISSIMYPVKTSMATTYLLGMYYSFSQEPLHNLVHTVGTAILWALQYCELFLTVSNLYKELAGSWGWVAWINHTSAMILADHYHDIIIYIIEQLPDCKSACHSGHIRNDKGEARLRMPIQTYPYPFIPRTLGNSSETHLV